MRKRHEIPPLVLGTRCVPIFIPDSPEYAQLLIFAIRKMCQQSYYVRDDTGTLAKETADNLKVVTLEPLIANLLTDIGCDVMPIDCDEIADCIDTNEVIQNLITQNNLYMQSYNTTNIGINETINNRSTLQQRETPLELLPPPPTGQDCNKDALWSGVLSVINYLDQITIDFLEQITASSDQNERYASWVKGLPFVGTLPIDEALEYTTYITQELENSYNGVVTLEFKQSISCEIFCILSENCNSLSAQFLMDYLFYTRLNIDPSTVALYSIAPLVGMPIEFLLQGQDMAIGMWGIAIWMTQAQANFYGGFGAKNLIIAYKQGLNSPDNDWTLLCDCPSDCEGTITRYPVTGWIPFAPKSSEITLFGGSYEVDNYFNRDYIDMSALNSGFILNHGSHCIKTINFKALRFGNPPTLTVYVDNVQVAQTQITIAQGALASLTIPATSLNFRGTEIKVICNTSGSALRITEMFIEISD